MSKIATLEPIRFQCGGIEQISINDIRLFRGEDPASVTIANQGIFRGQRVIIELSKAGLVTVHVEDCD